ncbi:metallophosphoesterase [Collinsella sp. AM28-11LB]|uniref:metallophosphoesterase family protein n=1 Tax=Collinsella sp. AM28-11LB TaxID=2292312 RepID=UPI001F314274|nr:metallophosphoesterase [Collinsella sp. AM28-11LB]
MTVYVTGDIHGGVDMQKLRDWDLGDSLTSDDYLIIAGDFGFLWDFSAEECADIAWLESRPYTVLFIDGNHERFDHWAERPMELWHGGLTQRLSDTSPVRRLTRGEVFELDGSTIFTMGGATSVDKEYCIPYSSWWPQELPDERNFEEARTKLGSVGWKVDYVITHTAPRACFRPRSIRRPAGITPPLIGLRHFSMSWKIAWTTSAGITGISIGMPTRPSAIPCSTTASFAWATNSSPGMLRRGGHSENFIRYLG